MHGRGGSHRVDAAHQWLTTTAGRIATCAHSWMTAVHWVDTLAAKGLYTPARSHGPKWGRTTLLIAQEIAGLTVCRPGIAYLMRKLKTSERTIQYHLDMLRESGLLVYVSKGTRVGRVGGQASVYERTIPIAFDEVHGIRTVGEGATRRQVGADEASRKQLGKLSKKATRKVRRRVLRTPVSGGERCTPMGGGTSAASPAASNYSPSESKLASGGKKSPTPKQKRSSRKLNKIGRRFQMASELIVMVPWLAKASRARIAWIVRDFADAGWTAYEVWAAAEMSPARETTVKRPSGLLAYRLSPVALRTATPAQRQTLVDDWRDSQNAAKARHAIGYDDLTPTGQQPTSITVQRLVAEAFQRAADLEAADAYTTSHTDGDVDLEALDRSLVQQMRADAAADPELVLAALAVMPETEVRRLYTHWIVDQALKTSRSLTPAF